MRSLQSRKPQPENNRKKQTAKDKGKRPADSDLPSSSRAQKRGPATKTANEDATVAKKNNKTTTTTAGVTATDAAAPGPSKTSKAAPSCTSNRGSVGIPEPSQSSYSKLGLQTKTIKELQGILKAWGLPVSGKKDDLVMRILDQQNGKQPA